MATLITYLVIMSKTIATMKKMIKNLMLVAVAAMAFVGCQQDIEVNSTTKKTTIDFIASFDTETRSQFVEDTDGDNVFQSVWNGGEQVLLFADAGNSVYATGTATMSTEDGTTGTFTAVFDGEVPAAGVVKAYVPASAWNVWSEAITIPATQTPTDHSVDSAAHILFGQTDYTDITTLDTAEIMFSHAVAYGKMTIADEFESIDEVTVTIDGTETYTLNTSALTSSTIWFACNANENVNELEVIVKSGDNAFVRTYELADGKLAFKTGRVSIFTVSNFEVYVAPTFTNEATTFYEYGDYNDILLVFSGDKLGTLQLNFFGAFDGNYITPGTYKLGDDIYIGNGTKYSYYQPAGSETKYQLNSGSVVVSVTEDKKYHFEFVDITYNEMTATLNSTYTGDIDGFGMPDTRTKLEAPVGNAPVVDGKTVTYTWSAVKGADRYYVYCTNESSIYATTTECTVTFTMPAYSTYYYFKIQAVADDTNTEYRSSDEVYLQTVPTGAEPVGDITFVSAVAAYNSNNPNWYDITFTDASNRTLSFTIGNGNVTYWNEGTWNSDYFYSSGFALGQASFNGGSATNIVAVVSVVDGAYKVEMTWDGGTGLYTGQIEGFVLPGEGGGEDETGATELTITRVVCTYAESGEVEIHFTDSNSNEWGIDFASANPLVAGTYSLANGTLIANYTQLCSTSEKMTACTVVVTDNGDTYNYNAQFTHGGKDYSFSVDSTVKGK